MITKRQFLASAAAAASLPFLGSQLRAAEPLKEIRIGFQKSGVLLIAKGQDILGKHFAERGIKVSFVEFAFGPPLLEALNAGAIDYGTTGDAPPVFAQAARANLYYVAALPARGDGQSIVVPKDSPIASLADLKGKKVAIAKASSAHSLTVAALESAGLAFADIDPQYLPPADAAAAFTRGAVDAWAIWDPFYALAEIRQNARALDIPAAARAQNTFFLANKSFTDANPGVVGEINEQLARASKWADANRAEAAEIFAKASGVELAAQQRTVARAQFNFSPLSEDVIRQQQAVADRFFKLGLLPRQVSVRDIVWNWKQA